MPAGRWLYIFILLFPTFLPERFRNGLSVSSSRATDEPELIPTITTSKARHTTSSRLPDLRRNTNSDRNRNFDPMPGTVNALFLSADSHRTQRIPDRRLVWPHNGTLPSNG